MMYVPVMQLSDKNTFARSSIHIPGSSTFNSEEK